jgi:catechol 2,3-dioxygenase-like lactoylglutathione lyase family enzyme
VLHHVGIEVAPGDVEATVRLFGLLGFERVEPPPALPGVAWLERKGTQIHLMPREEPTVPSVGHLAVVVADFEAAVERLRGAGFEVERRREYWGEPRALVAAPGGRRVELMASPPSPSA